MNKERSRSTFVECPKCQKRTESEVLKTNEGRFGTIRRRRQCLVCRERFTTIESAKPLPTYRKREGLDVNQNPESA